jgi:hypothetical protein
VRGVQASSASCTLQELAEHFALPNVPEVSATEPALQRVSGTGTINFIISPPLPCRSKLASSFQLYLS